jgi:hypothetical protein
MSRGRGWRLSAPLAIPLVAAAAVAAAVTLGSSTARHGQYPVKFAADPGSKEAKAGQANEGPDGTFEAQQAAFRSYPAATIPFSVTLNSIKTFTKLKKAFRKKSSNQWVQIGPTDEAKYPAVLDQFLAGGKPYDAAGRVTALGLGGCKGNGSKCRLYVAAAGGGIWVGDKIQGTPHWDFTSGSFATNAIGSLLVDPSDPSGNTVYAGTGEPNASVDSEAGMGIYKTTNGGQTWSLVPGSSLFQGRAISSMALDNSGNLLVGVARALRGLSQTDGAGTTNPPGGAPFGVYRQTGATFTQIWNGAGSIRGVNEVGVDPNTPTTLYATAFQVGVYRSTDNGTTWTQIHAPLDATLNTDRATFALAKLPGGFTRMYIGEGTSVDSGADRARVYRTDDAAGAATFTDITTAQSIAYCHGQCWYDNVVVSTAENPDVVYLGGSFSYDQVHGTSNGRAVLLSSDGGQTWSDMTIDDNNDGWIHPDQHALVTVPGSPLQFIAGDDGGVVASDGKFKNASGDCSGRGLSPADLAYCQSLLSRIPHQTSVLNRGLPTLQFQSLSVDPSAPLDRLMGGTQDNGTFQFSGSTKDWPQIIYGDGGQSGFNSADSRLRFNTFTGEANDVNFRDGDPTKWVIASAPIFNSPEGSLFYPPIIADPNSNDAGSIFEGAQSVWRTQDWGGNQAYLEANCPEFTTFAGQPGCGDFVQIGSPSDLTSPAYGDRAGGNVIAIARYAGNDGTMWVATTTGRVFVTDNANDPAGSVVFTRLDSSSTVDPNRVPTGIYIDASNPNRAWITYSGYSAVTPATPGHVFQVVRTGATATWTDITNNLSDLPLTAVARDDQTGDLYVANDFGVMKLPNASSTWTLAAAGMPMVEVPSLTIVPGARVLYAATHGLGAWMLPLSP